ncbi:Astacin [Portunus trituberculatus]|uniref:Astacin n=1 Tax=Portunus trituberculatus TaxID=210409 RepID=A0A5B7CXR4_PORTR|nr:Astacin [Portunus trituberculatus]
MQKLVLLSSGSEEDSHHGPASSERRDGGTVQRYAARLMFGREIRLPVDLTTGRPPDKKLFTVQTQYATALQQRLDNTRQRVSGHLKLVGQAIGRIGSACGKPLMHQAIESGCVNPASPLGCHVSEDLVPADNPRWFKQIACEDTWEPVPSPGEPARRQLRWLCHNQDLDVAKMITVTLRAARAVTSRRLQWGAPGMNDFHAKACVRFVERTTQRHDYIEIVSNYEGCWSYVGSIGGKQRISRRQQLHLHGHGNPRADARRWLLP